MDKGLDRRNKDGKKIHTHGYIPKHNSRSKRELREWIQEQVANKKLLKAGVIII